MTPEKLVYSVPEAAAIIGVSVWSYYERIKTNELPYRRIGRRLIVPKNQLEAWLAGRDAA